VGFAGAPDGDEELDLGHLAGLRIDDARLVARVVDEELLSRPMDLSHRELLPRVPRAGHDDHNSTMGYVKLAEDLSGVLGTPFAPLPEGLLSPSGCRSVLRRSSRFPEREKGFQPSTSTLAIEKDPVSTRYSPTQVVDIPHMGVTRAFQPLRPSGEGSGA